MAGPIAHGVERELRRRRPGRARPPASALGGWIYFTILFFALAGIVLVATTDAAMPSWLRAAVAIGPPSMVAAWFARLLRHDATPRRPVELLAGLVGWQMAPLRWLIERYGRAIAIPLHAVAWAGVWALPFAI